MDNQKIRKENIVWTVSEDYNYLPTIKLFDEYRDFDMDYYKMMVLGYVYKVVDIDSFMDFIAVHIDKTDLKNEFLKLIEIYLDDCFYSDLSKLRPGARDYRKYFIDKIIKRYKDRQDLTVEEELTYTYYARLDGKYVKTRPVVDDLIVYMRSRNTARTTEELINYLTGAFLKFFFINDRKDINEERQKLSEANLIDRKDKEKDKPNKETKARLTFKARKKNLKNLNDNDRILSVESAEFTRDIDQDVEVVGERLESSAKSSIVKSNEKIKAMIETRFGSSLYPLYVTESLEKDLCVGIHKGIKIHFTDGSFYEGNYDKYFARQLEDQRQINMDYYKENELIFRRAINELKNILKKRLILDDEDDFSMSKSGQLQVSKIWRHTHLGDENIFLKNNKQEKVSISVDILLDSSAPQLEREEYVSSQAYVITQALTELKVPTRVFSFCNFFNYTIMKKYRDYMDPETVNNKIFSFKGAGSNRDGLAIKVISSDMDRLDTDKKVLIILSDGRPNNKIDLGSRSFMNIDGEDYEGEEAIKDTAQEIFNMKLRDKHVLGVFTGEDEDLESEKRIYGKDFAYIRNLERFSKIIGFYLEQLLI